MKKQKKLFLLNDEICSPNELTILESHHDAKFFDHDFLSPTFANPIERHIKNYIKNYGGMQ